MDTTMTPSRLMLDILRSKGYSSLNAAAEAIEAHGLASKGAAQSALRRFVTLGNPLRQETMGWLCEFLGVDPSVFASDLAATNAARALGYIQGEASNVMPVAHSMTSVPLISKIQAGRWREIVDVFQPGDAEEWIPTAHKVSRTAFALRICGDSMYRPDSPDSFRDGDVVIIDPEVAPRPGSFVAARNGKEEATFKKYRPRGLNDRGQEYFELVPLNQDYPIMRSDLESITIIGTAVEMRKKL